MRPQKKAKQSSTTYSKIRGSGIKGRRISPKLEVVPNRGASCTNGCDEVSMLEGDIQGQVRGAENVPHEMRATSSSYSARYKLLMHDIDYNMIQNER
jgi:hypothetical protein